MSEALAITADMLYDGTLTVKALKSTDKDDIGLPKWEIQRVIPLSDTTLSALSAVTPEPNTGRYFHRGRSWGTRVFVHARLIACTAYPDMQDAYSAMTCHSLRHSMNTNLLVARQPPALVAEYLAWNHQSLIDMQARYTHIYAEAMRPICDAIDAMYGSDAPDIALTHARR